MFLKRLVQFGVALLELAFLGLIMYFSHLLAACNHFVAPAALLSGGYLTIVYAAGAALIVIALIIAYRPLVRLFCDKIEKRAAALSGESMPDLFFGGMGLLIGLAISFFLSGVIGMLDEPIAAPLTVCVYVVVAPLCARIGYLRWRELPSLAGRDKPARRERGEHFSGAAPKLLDTSVLIDGRILDICKAGFIEGTLIVPAFVLKELQHIADSSDLLKRNRGRKGLDVIAHIQKEARFDLIIDDTDFDDNPEVDIKLILLAKEKAATIVTNDYNLNKVASVTGLPVLNINELTNAVKTALLPGEELVVTLFKEGKEMGQGVGYLEDGTMIVVDNGKKYLGEVVEVVVTSVLQTSAGRMIFAKLTSNDLS